MAPQGDSARERLQGAPRRGRGVSGQRDRAAAAGADQRGGLDWYSFTVAFKGVLLEGLEVVFIVIAFGAGQGRFDVAIAGAAAAVVLVAVVGVLVRKPLERVPENTIKFTVGVMLTSFGCFWAAEGAGVSWPGDELSLLGRDRVRVGALVRARADAPPSAARDRHRGCPGMSGCARSGASGGTSSSATTGWLRQRSELASRSRDS